MTTSRRPDAATLSLMPLYLAVVVLGACVAHIASEFFAMGSEAAAVTFAPVHLYLGIGAAVSLGVTISMLARLWSAAPSGRDLKRLLHVQLETLPFRGRGPFYMLTAGLQLALSIATQYGEGCPFCAHDVASGILGALFTVLLLALAARAIARRLPSIAASLEALLLAPSALDRPTTVARANSVLAFPRIVWFEQLYNRPPPSLSI